VFATEPALSEVEGVGILTSSKNAAPALFLSGLTEALVIPRSNATRNLLVSCPRQTADSSSALWASAHPGTPFLARSLREKWGFSDLCDRRRTRRNPQPDVTSALAPEVRKADHYQGGSGSKPLEKKLASSLKSRF
jgi:hypothetical protein